MCAIAGPAERATQRQPVRQPDAGVGSAVVDVEVAVQIRDAQTVRGPRRRISPRRSRPLPSKTCTVHITSQPLSVMPGIAPVVRQPRDAGLLRDNRMLHRQDNAHEKDQREFLHDAAVQVKFFDWLVPLAMPLPCDAYRKRNPTSRGRRTTPKFMHAYPGPSAGHIRERPTVTSAAPSSRSPARRLPSAPRPRG